MNNFWENVSIDNDNPTLIVLSILIAATASYTALRARTQMNQPRWLGSIALGLGIWAADLTGLLVMKEARVSQSPWLIILSLMVAISAAGLALYPGSKNSTESAQKVDSPIRLLQQGIFWGLAIAVPHSLILASSMTLGNSDILIKCNVWLLLLSLILPTGLSALVLSFDRTTMPLTGSGLLTAAILGEKSIAEAAFQMLPQEGFRNGPLLKLTLETSWAIEKSSVIWAIILATVIIFSLMLWTINCEPLNEPSQQSASPQVSRKFSKSKTKLREASSQANREKASVKKKESTQPTQAADRDREDAALKASQARLAGIVNIADDGIITIDEHQRITLFNQGAEKIFGYSATEVLGQSLDMLLPKSSRKIHQQHIQEFSDSGDLARKMGDRRAIFARRRDGSEFPAEASISQLLLEGEKIFTVILRDISDRVEADAALKASQARLAGIVDIADDGIITIDEHQRITLFNQGAEKIFGYTATEVLGQSLNMLLPEGSRKIHQQHIHEFGKSGEQARKMGDRRAIFARRRNGSEFPAEASISQLVLGGETIFTVILRDISDRVQQETALRQSYEQLETRIHERTVELETANSALQAEIAERQQTELTLRESQHRYQTLANVAPVGIFHTNAEGKCLYVNDRWCEIAGMSHEEALGDGWINAIYPEDRQGMFDQWDRAAKANKLFKYEYRFLRSDGLENWVLGWAGVDRDEQGKLQGYVGTITDISDRKRVEEELRKSRQELEQRVQKRTAELAKATVALRESQTRLDGILASLDDLVWSASTETFQFLYLSPAVERIYGRSPAEFIENSNLWLNAVHPEDRERVNELSDEFRQTGNKDIEYRIVRPDGEVRWIRDRARLLYNEDGQPIRMDGIASDITERKQMQDILQEKEQRFRKIFTEGPLGMAVVGLDYQFVQVNERLCEMVGYPEAELMTLTFPDITHAEDIESDIHLVQQLARGEISYYTLEKRYLKKNQEIVWINLTGCLVRDEEKQPLYYLAIVEDISDRKQYEARLETERQQLQQIVTNAPVAMVMCDRELQVLAHSNQWLADYNLQQQSIVGQHLDRTLPDMPEHWREIRHRALQGEIIHTPEEIFTRQDGSKLYLRLAVNPWYTTDLNIGGIVIATNRIDELVKAREAALDNVRLKSEFLANMSHEIRTPMNGVLGMAGLLEQTELKPDQRDFVQTILSSAENLLNIINDILDFSKLEAGQMELESLDFDLKQCLEELMDLLAAPAHQKGLELASWVSRDLPTKLRGDAGRLRQILMNLVGNAIKFTKSGEVLVQAFLQSETETEVQVIFCIKDTGLGIPKEKQQKLFQSFSQVDASIVRKYGGTGLGLAISKQIVELMEGEIGVFSLGNFYPKIPDILLHINHQKSLTKVCESTQIDFPQFCEEEGATFWFTAKFEKLEKQFTKTLPKIPEKGLNGLRLLVVDDNATNRKIIRYQAQHWGMHVDEAIGGTEAIEALQTTVEKQQHYDAAILDMQMPEIDGETLGHLIHSNPDFTEMKLIMMTSMNVPNAKERMEAVGFSRYLVKPVKESRLRECLLSVLKSESVQQNTQSNFSVTSEVTSKESVKNSSDLFVPDSTVNQGKSNELLSELNQECSDFEDDFNQQMLIVEDNAINQKVLRHQLNRLGYENITIAANGQEALDLLEAMSYDLVLMDCQMPVLDGYRATELIRQREADGQHIAIIAMTAHAMKGDREKCLAAGMDDYLTKPINVEKLSATLKHWSKVAANQLTGESSLKINRPKILRDSEEIGELIDFERLEEISGGDLEFQQEILQAFFEDMTTLRKNLQEAIATEDLSAIQYHAHTIKGASSNVGLSAIARMAAILEQNAHQQENVAVLAPSIQELEKQFVRLEESIARHF